VKKCHAAYKGNTVLLPQQHSKSSSEANEVPVYVRIDMLQSVREAISLPEHLWKRTLGCKKLTLEFFNRQ